MLSLFQSIHYIFTDFIHIKRLERRKGAFHADQLHDRFFNPLYFNNKVSSARLFSVDLNLRFVTHCLNNFVGTGLECSSLLTGFNGNQSSSTCRRLTSLRLYNSFWFFVVCTVRLFRNHLGSGLIRFYRDFLLRRCSFIGRRTRTSPNHDEIEN